MKKQQILELFNMKLSKTIDNISKGLVRKLSDKSFLGLINKYDVLCLNECWVKLPYRF
jgi:hypothetical protein